MKVKVYTKEGQEKGTVELKDSVFGVPMNEALLHQAVVAAQSRKRQPRAHTKTRGEVRGGGKKPWRQKGIGWARHGSIRSPIWKGGGITFGPRKDKRYEKRLPDAMKKKALAVALSQKLRDGEVAVLEGMELQSHKTKEAVQMVDVLTAAIFKQEKTSRKPQILLTLSGAQKETGFRAVRNIPNVRAARPQDLNILDVLAFRYLILPKESIGEIEQRFK